MPLCIKCKCGNWIPAIGGPCPYCETDIGREDLIDRSKQRRFRRCAWVRITIEQDKEHRKNDLDNAD